MELLVKQNSIVDYIKEHFRAALTEYYGKDTDIDSYIQDFINLDRYQKSTQLFFNWSNYNFSALSLDSVEENSELHLILTFRNKSPEELHNLMMTITPILYNTISDSNGFGGIVDILEVTNIDFYEATDSDQNIKVADITVSMRDEIY